MPIDPPPGWGSDKLSEFVGHAWQNSFATFANLRPQYSLLRDIDQAYVTLIEGLNNPRPWHPTLFLLRAHAAYRGAVRLAISGQVVEAYMVLRGCLEAGLYGFYVTEDRERFKVWARRHEGEDARATCRDTFKIGRVFGALETRAAVLAHRAHALYDTTIDEGAHPNERAILRNLRNIEDDEGVTFLLNYLTDDSPSLNLCLKVTAGLGLCTLELFGLIYQERMRLIGLVEQLDRMKAEL
jgi:hypothetical protein